MPPLLHIASRADLAKSSPEQHYSPAAFADEGFIHCCWPQQLPGVIHRYYQGRQDLVLLELASSALADHLVEEDLYQGGEAFPHYYAPLPAAAIIGKTPLEVAADGKVIIPDNLTDQ